MRTPFSEEEAAAKSERWMLNPQAKDRISQPEGWSSF